MLNFLQKSFILDVVWTQVGEQYSRCGLTRLLYNCIIMSIFLCLIVRLTNPNILLALLYACRQCSATFRSLLTMTPRSLFVETSSSSCPFIKYEAPALLVPMCITLHLVTLNFIFHSSANLHRVLRSLCNRTGPPENPQRTEQDRKG